MKKLKKKKIKENHKLTFLYKDKEIYTKTYV